MKLRNSLAHAALGASLVVGPLSCSPQSDISKQEVVDEDSLLGCTSIANVPELKMSANSINIPTEEEVKNSSADLEALAMANNIELSKNAEERNYQELANINAEIAYIYQDYGQFSLYATFLERAIACKVDGNIQVDLQDYDIAANAWGMAIREIGLTDREKIKYNRGLTRNLEKAIAIEDSPQRRILKANAHSAIYTISEHESVEDKDYAIKDFEKAFKTAPFATLAPYATALLRWEELEEYINIWDRAYLGAENDYAKFEVLHAWYIVEINNLRSPEGSGKINRENFSVMMERYELLIYNFQTLDKKEIPDPEVDLGEYNLYVDTLERLQTQYEYCKYLLESEGEIFE
jgi:hypothetical protein